MKCKPGVCSGSIMKRDGVGFNPNTAKDQVLSEASEFLEAYYNTLPEKYVPCMHKVCSFM